MQSTVAYIRRHHVSLLALFVALGGTSYAAISLPANSVGTRQIKAHAVTASKLKPGLVSHLRGKKGATGATGPVGPAGASGSDGANGKDFNPSAVLASGQTETGNWSLSASTGQTGTAVVTFSPKLAAPIDFHHTEYLDDTTDEHCPAFDQATPGYVCFYAQDRGNFTNPGFITGSGNGGASVDGTILKMTATGPPSGYMAGTWAVTAP